MPEEEQPADADGAATGDERQTDHETDHETDYETDHETDYAPLSEDDAAPNTEPSGGRVFSIYGMVATVLGLVSVAVVVVGLVTWSMHRSDVNERTYRSRALQTAASWTSVLINLNADNVEPGMQRLRDKTVGQLNGEFDAAVQPYREVVQKIQSHSTGRIEAVAIESVHHDLGTEPGAHPPDPAEQLPGRTDTVMVIATSIAENIDGKPRTVHWNLQLNVTDVAGRLLISRLKSIR